MIARVSSVALMGMEARRVEVEVALDGGLPSLHVVGLPSAAVREAGGRIESAIQSSGAVWPKRKVTVSLAPGDVRKDGALLDLPLRSVCSPPQAT